MNSLTSFLGVYVGLCILFVVLTSLNAQMGGYGMEGDCSDCPGAKCIDDEHCSIGKCIGYDRTKEPKEAGYCELRHPHGAPCLENKDCYHECYKGHFIYRCRGVPAGGKAEKSKEECQFGIWTNKTDKTCVEEGKLPPESPCNATYQCQSFLKCSYGIGGSHDKQCNHIGDKGTPLEDGHTCELDIDCKNERCQPSTLKCCKEPEFCHLIYVEKGKNSGIVEGLPCTNTPQCIKKDLTLGGEELFCYMNKCTRESDTKGYDDENEYPEDDAEQLLNVND